MALASATANGSSANGRWSRSREGETLPGYTARATAFEAAVSMSAAYSIYSAEAHAEWHAVMAGFSPGTLPDGGNILVSRPDLAAVGGALLAAAGFATRPPTGRSGSSGEPQGWRSSATTLAGPTT
jgi:hypothetical protein